jgi:hypothetical protein
MCWYSSSEKLALAKKSLPGRFTPVLPGRRGHSCASTVVLFRRN